VSKAAEQIRIIHEADADADPSFRLARELFDKADRICFLGFGYHETNIIRLKLPLMGTSNQFFGSCYGMSSGEKITARALLNNRFSLGDENHGCRDLLRHLPIGQW